MEKKKIFIVEDDLMLLETVRICCESMVMTVRAATTRTMRSG